MNLTSMGRRRREIFPFTPSEDIMTNVSTQIADVIVPAIFTPYTQQLTMEKTAIIQSGIAARDDFLDNLLAGGGLKFTVPSWQDLGDPQENVSSDDPNSLSIPHITQTSARSEE